MSRDERFREEAATLGYDFSGELKVGGNYLPLIRDGDLLHVSAQVPRVGNDIVVTGAASGQVDLVRARLAAKICTLRALALLQRSLGSLDGLARALGISVFVQSAAHFTQQSEVADGASDLLSAILGEAGMHTRTSVGVLQLPKNASVEISLVARAAQIA